MNTRLVFVLAPLLVHCSSGGGSAASGGDASTTPDGVTTGGDGSGSSSSSGGGSDSGSTGDSGTTGGGDSGDAGGGGFTVGGCRVFAPQYSYNVDVSQAALDANSATYITGLKTAAPVIGLDYPGGEIYNVVPQSQAAVPVQTGSWFGFDSTGTFFFMADAGAAMAPIPGGVQFENQGTPNADHHMMVLQQGSCVLYEMYASNPTGPTTGWEVLAQWDLHAANEQIPDPLEIGSTTAAGTPLLPGVIWPDEVAAGEITHAIDIVMPANAIAKCQYVHPASDGAWSATGSFPYGGRLRLKASYDMTKVTGTQAKVVLRALQKYGMFNTDISGETRSSFRLGGLGPNQPWNMADIMQLGNLTWDDFDVVDLGTVYTMKGCM
ncbi:MAG TPA: hypothetical protein VF765_28845 [Polyangiaceae bacterium]